MNVQTAFVYCFLTVLIIYLFLYLEQRFLNDDVSKNGYSNRHLRISILCGILNWLVIVYFIYQVESNVPSIVSNAQVILQDKF
jgi:uncharacterized membrane protein